ncbi:MAG: TIGR01212 family radical SAM protein [Planctomycetota bacterium]
MARPLPFHTLRPWLARTFGRAVHRVALDAGSSCPNRDGTKAFGGCTYCDVEGSGTGAWRSGTALAAQLEAGIRRVRRRDPECGVIAYFQSYSNTYVPRARLDEVLAVVEPHLRESVVAVSVATRPDTLSDDALETLATLARRVPVWLELGLEAADDKVLADIRRFHTVAEFDDAAQRASAAGLLVVGHAILGLPNDGRDGARRTAHALSQPAVAAVKVHQLMVLRRTQLEKAWQRGEVALLDVESYVAWAADFVERLRPDQVLHRWSADAADTELCAPRWDVAKNEIRDLIAAELWRRGTEQGSHTRGAAPRHDASMS